MTKFKACGRFLVVCVGGGIALASPVLAFGPFPPGTSVFVDVANGGPGDGSEADPFPSIQTAIDAAGPGEQVGVAPGVHVGSFIMKAGVDLVGFGASNTKIDADGANFAVQCANDSRLSGFQITNSRSFSGAIQCGDVENVVISDNEIDGLFSDAMRFFGATGLRIARNRVTINPAFAGPCPCDGIVVNQSSFLLSDNFVDGTDSNGNSDAISIAYSDLNMTESFVIERNEIIGELSMSNVNSTVPLQNVIRNNVFTSGNGFSSAINIAFSRSAGAIVNNTSIGGSGIFLQGGSIATIANNVLLFGNTGIVNGGSVETRIFNNNAFGNSQNYRPDDLTNIDGNISVDPSFVDFDGGDYLPTADSPLVDAGENDAADLGAEDFADSPRIVDGDEDGIAVVDVGAFEFQPQPIVSAKIDIRPRTDRNAINLMSHGVIPVAILGSETFDVFDVDVTTLRFAPAGALPLHREGGRPGDVNRDGLTDLISHYRIQETGIPFGATEACVMGKLLDGTPFEGCDHIFTSGCGLGFEIALLLPPLAWLRQRRRGGAALTA